MLGAYKLCPQVYYPSKHEESEMKNKTGVTRHIFSLLVALGLLLTGCRPAAKNGPTAVEVAKVSSAAGFLAARAEESGGFIAGADQRDQASEYAYLYDNALAAIALSYAGAQAHAETIADAFVFAQGHDRTFQDGRLRNAYTSGDPKSDSGRSIAAGKVTIRLPGFWKDGHWQEDYQTVSTSSGNMAWAILGLCRVAENAAAERQSEYLRLPCGQRTCSGFAVGQRIYGRLRRMDDVQTRSAIIRHNISLLSALPRWPTRCETEPERQLRMSLRRACKALSMYDEKLGCFYTGTEEDGRTISTGIIPLDTNSLAVLALGRELKEPGRTLAFAEERMMVGQGFDFSTGDLDGIWNEGTAQMAVCYQVLNYAEKEEAVMTYLKTQMAADGSVPAADRDGVSTGFAISGTDLLWEYNNVQSISATGWFAFAQLGKNPLERPSEQSSEQPSEQSSEQPSE